MPTMKMTGIDELRALVRLFDRCQETFNEQFTPEELLTLFRVHAQCSRDFFPDEWSARQVREALAGKVPEWNDDETAKYDTAQDIVIAIPEDGWGLTPTDEDAASYCALVAERVGTKYERSVYAFVSPDCRFTTVLDFPPNLIAHEIAEFVGTVWDAWCAGERVKETP